MRRASNMITRASFLGKWFKNKKDDRVVCTCCGRKISKGYVVAGMNLGEDCYINIECILDRDIKQENEGMVRFFSLKPMHFQWIARA